MATLRENEELGLEELLSKLEEKFPKEIVQTLLYGSKARGDSNSDSDIDLLVILKKRDHKIRWEILTLASQVSLKYDLLINPMISNINRVERQRGFSFYKNAARDAIPLELQQGHLKLNSGVSLV